MDIYSNAMDMESSRIRRVSVLAWTLCCYPVLRKQKAGKKSTGSWNRTGIIPILMEAKTEATDFTALEIQEESADMARRSVAYNHLEDKIKVITGDIRDASNIFGASSFSCHHNKPAVHDRHSWGKLAIHSKKRSQGMRFLCTLDDILRESAKKCLCREGRFLYGTPPVPSGRDHE